MLFSLEEQMDIELILTEASAYGLSTEVEEYAQKYLSEGCTPVEAYEQAYYEWIK
jgi:predicted transcriptional regulator